MGVLLTVSLGSAQQKTPIKIGVNMDITGYAGWTGEPSLRATQLYVEQVNAQGGIDGHPIELVIQDNESNPEKSTSVTKKLIQRDKVLAIMGPTITATTNAARPVVQEEKIVLYSNSASFETNFPDSFCFAAGISSSMMVDAIFDYFMKKGFKRVAILCATDSTGQAWFEMTTTAAKKYGIEFASERFNVKDMDVTSQLAKLKGINPQGLIVGVSGAPNAVIAKNFNQMGFNIPYATGAGNISDSFLKLMAGIEPETLIIPGAYCVVWKDLPDSFPQKKLMTAFNEAFQRKFKKEIDIYAAYGYDAIRVTVEAIRQVKPEGPQDSVKIRNAIEKIKDFPAVYGTTYTFSKDDHRGLKKDACVMVQIKGEKFVMTK
jgi:branched-chain amino acid transport system substrate-binding protein